MDPFSLTIGAVGLVSVAAKLAQSCVELHQFWESLQDAPAAIRVIKNDLLLLSKILEDIANEELSPAVLLTLDACQSKLEKLEKIVKDLDPDSAAASPKRERIWAKYRMVNKIKEVENFQKGLSEVRSTLMLGLMYQNIQRPRLCFTNQDVQNVQVFAPESADTKSQLRNPVLTKESSESSYLPPDKVEPPPYKLLGTPSSVTQRYERTSIAAIGSNPGVQKFLQRSIHMAVDELFASGTVERLMESSLNQVTSFDTAYRGTYEADDCDISKVSVTEEEKPGPAPGVARGEAEKQAPRMRRSKTCHQKSSMGVVLGSIWIRTSTLKAAQGSSTSSGELEVITSFIFYPASWLTRVGLRYGTEANLQWSPGTGWKFNISAVKAVPESSLIFDMCREGNVRGVEMMMSRGEASVKDTSPKGWTPLHFAAASGHADLCAALIKAGADKQALAFEGPTEGSLSPLAIWSEFCGSSAASKKVEMMRVFGSECLDVSEVNADGWIVGHNLIASMSQEQCPMSETSVHWIFNQKQSDILIALGANSIWHGIQQAVRAFLIEEHQNQIIHTLLAAGRDEDDIECETYVRSIGHWIALRASERDLLPMACMAAQILQVDGFDPLPGTGPEGLGRRKINGSLPSIYIAWAKTSSRVLSNAQELIEAELDSLLDKLSMDRESFTQCIQGAKDDASVSHTRHVQRCYICHDNYTTLGTGLVRPRKISFDECRATQHKFHCQCVDYLQRHGVIPKSMVPVFGGTGDFDVEEEFCKEPDINVEELCAEYDRLGIDDQATGDPFCEAATLLYRAQGRRWIGSHEALEAICGECFLQQERYIGADGIAGISSFTPVPNTYISACPPDTLDAVYVN